jgi:hypothetical protein
MIGYPQGFDFLSFGPEDTNYEGDVHYGMKVYVQEAYVSDPETLRLAAQWLIRAATILEERQNSGQA